MTVSEADIDAGVRVWDGLDVDRNSLSRSGGIEGLRGRFRTFLEFSRVKATVVGSIVIDDRQVNNEYLADPLLRAIPLDEAVSATIRRQVAERESERRWKEWLRRKRECSTIVIYDRSFSIASSTPRPGCDSNASP